MTADFTLKYGELTEVDVDLAKLALITPSSLRSGRRVRTLSDHAYAHLRR